MFDTIDAQRRVVRVAWASALATVVLGQLHALARFRTDDGLADLELPTTAFWAEPAGRVLDPLVAWAAPDTVYLTYGKWWPIAIAVMVAAGVVRMRLRRPVGLELWAWRATLLGYALLAVGAGAYYWGQWTTYNVLEDIGLWADVPGILLGTLGGTVLGVALLRRGARPRAAAVILLLSIPILFLVSQVTSLGNTDLPAMFAMAMLAGEAVRGASASGRVVDGRESRMTRAA